MLRIVPDFRIARHSIPATNRTFDALRQKYVVPAWRKAGFLDDASPP